MKNKKDFWSYFKNVWELWELRNKFDWVIVDGNSKPIINVKLDELFKSLKLKEQDL